MSPKRGVVGSAVEDPVVAAPRRFRFGVLRAERALARWELRSIAGLRALGGDLAAVVVAPDGDPPPGPIARMAEALAREERRSAPADMDLPADGHFRLGTTGTLRAIADLELDFVLAFEPTGMILPVVGNPDELARHGLWIHAFTVADEAPSLPPGFDAVTQGVGLASVALTRLTSSGLGLPLEREWLRVEPHSYRRTRSALSRAAAELAARAVQRDPSINSSARPLTLPTTKRRGRAAAGRLLLALFARDRAQRSHRALFRQDWNVGIIRRPISTVLDGLDVREIEWLPAMSGDVFLADPFGIPLPDGRCLLLAEEYRGSALRGRIVAATLDGPRYAAPPEPILELGVHLSYPYVMADDDGWVITPESSAALEVASYRVGPDLEPAQRVATLLEGFPAVDPTIVQYDGWWWLFATDRGQNEDGHLHLWYGEHPSGPWTAHAHSAVKCDVRSSRPGGTPFIVDGVLYRPAQDDSQAYGGAVVVNRVDVLSPEAFAETTVARVEPDPRGPYPSGIHTVSAAGDLVLVDGKRYRFAPISKLRRHLPGRRGR